MKISGTNNTTGLSHSDATVAKDFAAALRTVTTYTSPSVNGNVWTLCNRYSGEVWINPPATCSGSNCPSPGYIIRPGIGNLNWGGINTATCGGSNQWMELRFILLPPYLKDAGTLAIAVGGTHTGGGAYSVSNGGTLIQNSILNPTTTLFAGTESFGATSTVTVSNWFSPTLPLINSINSNFGSVNLNWGTGTNWWKNQGLGVTRTIAGNLTVGTGCQTFLDSSNAAVSISIGGSLTVNGKLRIKYLMPGAVTFLASGNGNIGAAGEFNGTFGGNGNVSFTIQNLTVSVRCQHFKR
jgi:hypothetical protein